MKRMMSWSVRALALAGGAATAGVGALPFTESFDADNAGWAQSLEVTPASWTGAGGADGGGFISGVFDFTNSVDGETPLVARSTAAGSGGAFAGDWLSSGVTALSFSFRHNAPFPVTVFSRLATPTPGSAAIALNFAPVLPDVWTDIVIPITPANPQFITFEASSFGAVFADISRVQMGVFVDESLEGFGAPVTFDVDEVTIVPGPGVSVMVAGPLGLIGMRRRRHGRRRTVPDSSIGRASGC